MRETLPVGSIIKIGDACFMIAGYQFDRILDKLQSVYIIEKYPIGFLGEKSVAALPQDATFDVIFKGYSNCQFDEYLKAQQTFEEELTDLNPDDIADLLDKAVEEINRRLRDDK